MKGIFVKFKTIGTIVTSDLPAQSNISAAIESLAYSPSWSSGEVKKEIVRSFEIFFNQDKNAMARLKKEIVYLDKELLFHRINFDRDYNQEEIDQIEREKKFDFKRFELRAQGSGLWVTASPANKPGECSLVYLFFTGSSLRFVEGSELFNQTTSIILLQEDQPSIIQFLNSGTDQNGHQKIKRLLQGYSLDILLQLANIDGIFPHRHFIIKTETSYIVDSISD